MNTKASSYTHLQPHKQNSKGEEEQLRMHDVFSC